MHFRIIGYELTQLSAPGAMQGLAMGILYLLDTMGYISGLIICSAVDNLLDMNIDPNSVQVEAPRQLGLYGGYISILTAAMVVIVLAEKRFNLGLHWN